MPCSPREHGESELTVRDRDTDPNRSDIEPIEVIFQKIAEKQQMVPRSIERGASYQALHDPAPSSARSPANAAPSVVVEVTTSPAARGEPSVIDVEPRRRASFIALALALAVAFAIGVAALHIAGHGPTLLHDR
jgi:hypothetical protein